MRGSTSYSLILSLLISLCAVSAFAQVPTGTIRGIVADSSKAVVPNATVTARNKATGAERKTATNATGEYEFVALSPGQYEVKVAVSGFKTGLGEVTLQVGESVSTDFDLVIGQANETVTVTSDTPAINTSDSANGEKS